MRKRILFNTAALIVSNVAVRVLGLLYKIWLSRSISNEALGIYQLSLSIYMLFITFVASGLPNVVSRYSAARLAKGDKYGAGSVLKTGLRLGLYVSCFTTAFLLASNKLLAGIMLKDIAAYPVVLVLIPAVFFGGLGAICTGYLHALGKSWASAISEFIEQVAKIATVIAIFYLISIRFNDYSGAAIACLGLGVGGVVSYIITRLYCGKLPKELDKALTQPILKAAAPLTANRLLGSALQMAIAFIIPLQLVKSGLSQREALAQYGILTGMAIPIIFLPSTITSAVSVVLLPDIAKTRAQNKVKWLNSKIIRALVYVGGISLFFCVFSMLIATPAGDLLYKQPLAGRYILYLAPITVFTSINHIAMSTLSGLGYEGKIFKINLTGNIVTLVVTYVLVAIPRFGLYGHIIAIYAQAILCFILNLITLYNVSFKHAKGQIA